MTDHPSTTLRDTKRTIDRIGFGCSGAVTQAAAVGRRYTASLFDRTIGRLRRRSSGRQSEPEPAPAAETETGAATDANGREPAPARDRPVHRPTTRAELAELGLSAEGYVRDLLSQHGGRMKQRRFVDDYGWTATTISRLLSDLEADDHIFRYRVGREKVVCLPEIVPDSARQ